ncbi:MAG: hypothetical protein QXU09_01295 [Thermoproteota archaeon]|nr:hypothetical protein [Candidatus Brockarchaeota archaeon]
MMNKPLKVVLLVSSLILSVLIICASLMSVIVQADNSQKDFKYWPLGRDLPGFFKRGWFQNFTEIIQIGPYCNRFKWRFSFINVSEEFKENVANVAKNDEDVQKLLSEGYNITCIRPIISTSIGKDGSVVTKAKSAVLVLRKNFSGIAFVWVDVEKGKVTRIEIITRTVIEKP